MKYWRPTRLKVVNGLLGRRAYVPLCIIGIARSGTSLLRHCLSAHPDIMMHGEVFDQAPTVRQWGVELPEGEKPPFADQSVRKYLNQYVFPRSVKERKVVGFKLLPFHFNNSSDPKGAWQTLLSVSGLKAIHIRRMNTLDNAISAFIAERDEQWSHIGNEPPPRPAPLRIGFKELEKRIDAINSAHENLKRRLSKCDALYVTYEELTTNPDSELARIQRWIGVDVVPLSPSLPLRKQRVWTREESIERYSELKDRFLAERPDLAQYFLEPEAFREVPARMLAPQG